MKHSPLPFTIQPTQADHGESTAIVDDRGRIVAKIPSRAWNPAAILKHPSDRHNAVLIATACNAHRALVEALQEIRDICNGPAATRAELAHAVQESAEQALAHLNARACQAAKQVS